MSHKTDAVAIDLDHREGYSVTVLFPYTIANGEPALAEPFAIAGDADIFPSPKPSHD